MFLYNFDIFNEASSTYMGRSSSRICKCNARSN